MSSWYQIAYLTNWLTIEIMFYSIYQILLKRNKKQVILKNAIFCLKIKLIAVKFETSGGN